MLLKNLIAILCLLGSLLLTTSCVKDVDFGQDHQFTIGPDIAIKLADFRFHSQYFLDTLDLPVQQRQDTVALKMMDPDLINELDSVAFYFGYENNFRRSFDNTYIFYSKSYVGIYEVRDLHIEPGQPDNPHLQDTTVVVSGELMDRLKEAAFLEISLSIGNEPTSADGLLTAEVFAIYYFSERTLK